MDPFRRLDGRERALLRPAPLPSHVEPMKAVLTAERFSDPGWIYERKLDGIRCIAIKGGGRVRLLSRNAQPLDARFPPIRDALAADPADAFVVDGEVVALVDGQTSFAALQQRGGGRRARPLLYLFDVLHLAGMDTTALPQRARKALLRDALRWRDPVRLTVHRNEHGARLYREACRNGWEGLIAKRADAPYVQGLSRDWLKMKCDTAQEMVIGGWTAPRGSRTDLGALLIGVYDGGVLRYAGKVGTGFTQATLGDLAARLAPLRRDASPFADAPRLRDATWVEPRLVAQVGFTEWTRDGRLRHPRFLGMRDDKAPEEVARE
ncbi:MAG TPA: non-homologous end-joining DNA ligase [Miltoncostaeaceae bacterium]|nr:non-homologous end-joining DNA ligase [Miltoncostaeaceae bacterium]